MAETKNLDRVVIRFVGDSGDGMQLTGTEFAKAAAEAGNDISTFPDFPAEIRAPAGSLFGVSGFQLHFSSSDIHTPGDAPDVLVAMNPAGLKTNIKELVEGGTLIVNTGTFIEANLKKAGYTSSPLEGGELEKKYKVHPVDISHLTNAALEDTGLSNKEKGRAKNFFALGLVFWMYGREPETEIKRIYQQFAKKPEFGEANVKVFKAGFHYGETAEVFQTIYKVAPASFAPGMYRNITGNEALALGLVVGSHLAGKRMFYSGYPITPASSILHSVARYKNYGCMTFQAEDEIAAMSAAIGAAYGGSIAVTASSGPGIALKGEAIGLARDDRAAARRHQRAARRPRRRACPPRPNRPTSSRPSVRPQRRVAGAGARHQVARRLLLLRHRGGAHRGHPLHGAGHGALRRLPGQRLGAVAAARASPACSRIEVKHRTEPEGLLRLPPRPADPGARVGHPRHARPRAPHRRYRERLAHRQHQLRPGQPREA